MAESLGGARPGARKEARFRGWGGQEARGRAGERAAAAATAEEEEEAAGVRPPRGAPPPPPHPLSSAPRAPGGAGVRGAGQGGGAAATRAGAHPSSERTPLAATLVAAPQVLGGPRRCACGARGRRGERPLPCPDPARVARRNRAKRKASASGGRGFGRVGSPFPIAVRRRWHLRANGRSAPSPTAPTSRWGGGRTSWREEEQGGAFVKDLESY